MDISLCAVTGALLALLMCACILPASGDSADDQGDGRTQVLIPRPVKTSPYRPRTLAFLAVTALLGFLFLGWQRPSLPGAYADAVRTVASAITRDPVSVNGYVARLRPATQFLAVAYICGIATVLRASLARRLAVLGHVVLYLAMSLLLDALMVVGGLETGWTIVPFGVEATLANLLIGGLVVMRLTFTTFMLPRATAVPGRHDVVPGPVAAAACALVVVSVWVLVIYAVIAQPAYATSVWQVFVPLYALSILFALTCAPLWAAWWDRRKLPQPGEHRPPVDVIIPAYNEAANIARLLRSVDIAAGRYGGPVRLPRLPLPADEASQARAVAQAVAQAAVRA